MSMEERLAAAEAQIATLAHELGRVQDLIAIRKLQHSYGFMMDKGLYDEICDLFAPDGALHFMGGVWQSRDSVRRLYCGRLRESFTHGVNGPAFGMMCEHGLSQDVIDVAPDRQSAQARWRVFLVGGAHESKTDRNERLPLQWWEFGIYENEYVRRDGIWMIKKLGYNLLLQADYETGWAHSPPLPSPFFTKTIDEDPLGPDYIESQPHKGWPDTPLVPFHYLHPVTGKPIEAQKA
jgi:carotenoid cleavage dioxygenase